MPELGVGKENRWIAEVYADHHAAHGRLAVVDILDVQREDTSRSRCVPPFVDFRWRVVEPS